MRRRDFLRTASALPTVAAIPRVARAESGHVARDSRRAEAGTLTPYARLAIDGAAEAVVGDDGTTAYVAATTGFAVVDVADPTAPELLAERRDIGADLEDGPLRSILDVKVDGDRLLVAGPAQNGRLKGFVLYDVADPANPSPVTSFYTTPFGIHNCFLTDGYAYLTANGIAPNDNAVVIMDVSGDSPEHVSTWSLLDYDDKWADVSRFFRIVHDVYVHDGTAYVAHWDAGTWLLDVTDPATPAVRGHVADHSYEQLVDLTESGRIRTEYEQPPGNSHYVAVNDAGTLMGVGVESWDATPDDPSGGPGGITLYDVRDAASPTELAFIPPNRAAEESYSSGTWTTSHNFDFAGDVLYTSWYQDGVRAYDVSTPSSPSLIGAWRDDRRRAAFWTAQATRGDAFVASSADLPNGETTDEALYTFPTDPAAAPAEPPAIPLDGSGRTTTATRSTTRTSTATRTDTTTPNGTDTTTDGTDTTAGTVTATDADGQSGFGVLAALGGVGLGAWRAWRGHRDE